MQPQLGIWKVSAGMVRASRWHLHPLVVVIWAVDSPELLTGVAYTGFSKNYKQREGSTSNSSSNQTNLH